MIHAPLVPFRDFRLSEPPMGWSKTRRRLNVFTRRVVRNLLFPVAPPHSSTSAQSWVEAQHADRHTYCEIDESQRWRRRVPRCIDDDLHWRFHELEASTGPTFVASIRAGRIFGKYGVVITPDNLVALDLCHEYGSPPGEHSVLHQGNLPRVESFSGRLGLLATKGSQGFFHWVFDEMPRLGLLAGEDVDRYYVHVEHEFQRQYLRLFGVADEQIFSASRFTHVRPTTVVAPSLPGSSGVVTDRSRRFLRRALDRVETASPIGKRVYVSRGDVAHRRVSNEPAVIGVLKRLGFQEARLAGLAVAEQIAVFANAEVIVAPHGAGLSNLVYAAPRTRVLEMFSPNYVHPCYWSLSCLCELDYAYLLGVGPRPAPGVDPHRHREHLTIDTDQLRLAVKSLLDD